MHIELLKPHTHAGKRLAVGDRLDLTDASATLADRAGRGQARYCVRRTHH